MTDLNGDGILDVAVLMNKDAVVFLGQGDGTFKPGQSYNADPRNPTASIYGITFLAAADFNGDGKVDLASGFSLLLGSSGLATTTTLVATPNLILGQSATLTATVSPADASGSIRFFDSPYPGQNICNFPLYLGAAALVNGQAQITVSLPSCVGDHTLSAFYDGDLTFGLSSSVVIEKVNPIPTTTSLTSTPNSTTYGQPVTLTASVLPADAAGSVVFLDGSIPLGTRLLTGGTAVFSTPLAAIGTHSFTASYKGDPTHGPSASPGVTVTVNQGSVTTPSLMLASSANPVIVGQPLTLTALLSQPNATGTVTFYLGTTILGTSTAAKGTASITTRIQSAGTATLKAIYSGDANNTLSTSNLLSQTVRAISSVAFGYPVTTPAGINPTVVADVNGDGKNDLAGLTPNPTGNAIVGVGVQMGNGDGTFQPSINTFLSDSITAFAVGDLNRDGITDMAVIHSGKLAVLLGKGDGTFRLAVDNIVQTATSVAVADFNGDGNADLAVAISTATQCSLNVLPGNGDGTFRAAVSSPISLLTSVYGLTPADFNGDGITDLAYIGYFPDYTREGVFLGNGDGTFQAPSILLQESIIRISGLNLADFSGAGITDLVAETFAGGAGGVGTSLYGQVNSGDGTFKQTFSWNSPNNEPGSVAVGDFDGDGKADLAVTYNNSVYVYKGNGDGTFQAPVSYGSGSGYTLAADFNGDGRLDLAGANGGNINVILGTANPSSISSISPTGAVIYSPAIPLQVYGSNFKTNSVVQWNGTNLPTTFVSATQLSTTIPATDLTTPGSESVTVLTPTPDGGISNASTFTVTGSVAPVLDLNAYGPTWLTAGGPPAMVTFSGSALVAQTQILLNGVARPTRVVSINAGVTTIATDLSSADLAAPQVYTLSLFTPPPGGGTSSTAPLTVLPPPILSSAGLVNSASFEARVAAGGLATLFGSNFGVSQTQTYWWSPAKYPLTLGGVSLLLNGIAAPIDFVGPNQINFQVPWELQGQSPISAVVVANGVKSASQNFSLSAFAPGIFTLNEKGQAAALLAGTSQFACNSLTVLFLCYGSPAVRGNAIEIYVTGLGSVTYQPASGAPPSPYAPQAVTLTQPTVTVGGVTAPVLFSGLAPGNVGLYQVNVQVPANAPTGDAVPIVIVQGGVTSNTATIAVR